MITYYVANGDFSGLVQETGVSGITLRVTGEELDAERFDSTDLPVGKLIPEIQENENNTSNIVLTNWNNFPVELSAQATGGARVVQPTETVTLAENVRNTTYRIAGSIPAKEVFTYEIINDTGEYIKVNGNPVRRVARWRNLAHPSAEETVVIET